MAEPPSSARPARMDAHAHIERGPYTLEWLGRFVQSAARRGVERLSILEHGHRFPEFSPTYREARAHPLSGAYVSAWLDRRADASLDDYRRLADAARARSWPLRIEFGLEICWLEGEGGAIERAAGKGWDFLTGSVHHVRGFAFDHPALRDLWLRLDPDEVWAGYFAASASLAESGLFDRIAHPDSIKCAGFLPSFDAGPHYRGCAAAFARSGLAAECSSGLANNYGLPLIGPAPEYLDALVGAGVPVLTASDAHRPEDAGLRIADCERAVALSRLRLGAS